MTETSATEAAGQDTSRAGIWSRIAASEGEGYENDFDIGSRIYAPAASGYPVALLIHGSLIPLFYVLDRFFLAGFNLLSVLLFAVCILLNRRGQVVAAFLLGSIEICIHAILATLILGVETGFFLFLLIQSSIVILGPMREWHMRVMSCAMFAVLAAILIAYVLIAGPSRPLGVEWTAVFLAGNMLATIFVLALMLRVYDLAVTTAEAGLKVEHDRSEALLDNIMPPKVSMRLKAGEEPIADSHAQVTVLFADIVGFTERSATMPPEQLLKLLNAAFTRFDRLVEARGLEKIKTIGDAYMVVGGLPEARDDHAQAVAGLALEMIDACEEVGREIGDPLSVRVGINSGPVVAGVIGESKLAYDLWGDVVNTASRMESHGEPGRVQITAATKELLEGAYSFEPREGVEIKGKGAMTTYFLKTAK